MQKVDVYLNVGVKKHRFETGSMKWYKEFYSKHPQLHVVKIYQNKYLANTRSDDFLYTYSYILHLGLLNHNPVLHEGKVDIALNSNNILFFRSKQWFRYLKS